MIVDPSLRIRLITGNFCISGEKIGSVLFSSIEDAWTSRDEWWEEDCHCVASWLRVTTTNFFFFHEMRRCWLVKKNGDVNLRRIAGVTELDGCVMWVTATSKPKQTKEVELTNDLSMNHPSNPSFGGWGETSSFKCQALTSCIATHHHHLLPILFWSSSSLSLVPDIYIYMYFKRYRNVFFFFFYCRAQHGELG